MELYSNKDDDSVALDKYRNIQNMRISEMKLDNNKDNLESLRINREDTIIQKRKVRRQQRLVSLRNHTDSRQHEQIQFVKNLKNHANKLELEESLFNIRSFLSKFEKFSVLYCDYVINEPQVMNILLNSIQLMNEKMIVECAVEIFNYLTQEPVLSNISKQELLVAIWNGINQCYDNNQIDLLCRFLHLYRNFTSQFGEKENDELFKHILNDEINEYEKSSFLLMLIRNIITNNMENIDVSHANKIIQAIASHFYNIVKALGDFKHFNDLKQLYKLVQIFRQVFVLMKDIVKNQKENIISENSDYQHRTIKIVFELLQEMRGHNVITSDHLYFVSNIDQTDIESGKFNNIEELQNDFHKNQISIQSYAQILPETELLNQVQELFNFQTQKLNEDQINQRQFNENQSIVRVMLCFLTEYTYEGLENFLEIFADKSLQESLHIFWFYFNFRDETLIKFLISLVANSVTLNELHKFIIMDSPIYHDIISETKYKFKHFPLDQLNLIHASIEQCDEDILSRIQQEDVDINEMVKQNLRLSKEYNQRDGFGVALSVLMSLSTQFFNEVSLCHFIAGLQNQDLFDTIQHVIDQQGEDPSLDRQYDGFKDKQDQFKMKLKGFGVDIDSHEDMINAINDSSKHVTPIMTLENYNQEYDVTQQAQGQDQMNMNLNLYY